MTFHWQKCFSSTTAKTYGKNQLLVESKGLAYFIKLTCGDPLSPDSYCILWV